MPPDPEKSRTAVLTACRRLAGRRDLTPLNLARATGLGVDTCRTYRDELAARGVIAANWPVRRRRETRNDGIGLSVKDSRVVNRRIALVREAKRRIGGDLDIRTLYQILPD